jgi:hypothetical protein
MRLAQVEAGLLQGDGQADQHQHGPHRRREIVTNADQQVQPMHAVQATRWQHRAVLQIALAPAAVAHQHVRQRRWAFLVTAAQPRRHVDGPATATKQRGLHEIMAEHSPFERLAAAKMRQAGMAGERCGPDDGVVSPVVAFRAMPPGDAMRDHRAIHAAGELLHAREERAPIDDHRQRLDQCNAGVAFHRIRQTDQGVAGHQAVGIQDQHLRIRAAETPHPFGDVARLALHVLAATAIEHACVGTQPAPQSPDGRHFLMPNFRARGVAEDEEVEATPLSRTLQRLMHRMQAGQHAMRVFVVGRQQQGRARR